MFTLQVSQALRLLARLGPQALESLPQTLQTQSPAISNVTFTTQVPALTRLGVAPAAGFVPICLKHSFAHSSGRIDPDELYRCAKIGYMVRYQ